MSISSTPSGLIHVHTEGQNIFIFFKNFIFYIFFNFIYL